jgi:hypothetical protein
LKENILYSLVRNYDRRTDPENQSLNEERLEEKRLEEERLEEERREEERKRGWKQKRDKKRYETCQREAGSSIILEHAFQLSSSFPLFSFPLAVLSSSLPLASLPLAFLPLASLPLFLSSSPPLASLGHAK